MAVVLRPVEANHRVYLVPLLRVGVTPKSRPENDGYVANAGEEFYLDLLAGMEDLPDRDDCDLVPENLEREKERPAEPLAAPG